MKGIEESSVKHENQTSEAIKNHQNLTSICRFIKIPQTLCCESCLKYFYALKAHSYQISNEGAQLLRGKIENCVF